MFYEFRLSSDATQNKDTNSVVFKRIQSFGDGKTGWRNHNPIKVKISVSGKIEKA
jgi:CRISPR-associated endonuclease Csn1